MTNYMNTENGWEKLTGRHIKINSKTDFYKSISLIGAVVLPDVEWMDEADGKMKPRYVVDSLLPSECTYYAGRTSNTNEHGYVILGSTNTVVTQNDIDAGNEPANFHPYLKIEIKTPKHGKWKIVRATKMNGSWQ